MRIFLKNIDKEDINLIYNFPIQGLIFSINQENAEKTRDIINKIPDFITVLGEFQSLPGYEMEELIYFCKLQGVIINAFNKYELSCPIIFSNNQQYNALVFKNSKFITDNINFHQISKFNNIFGLVLSKEDFLLSWSSILTIWSKIKVV